MAIQPDIFARHADGLPPVFLRALALRESGLNPNVVHPTSRATGLFQITAVVLKDYNAANGTAYTLPQLVEPALNTRIAVWYIKRMLGAFAKVPALTPNWQDRRFVELFVNGWNAGPNGLIATIKTLEASGVPREKITVDAVNEAARATKPASYLAVPERTRWAKAVAATYFGDKGAKPMLASMVPSSPSSWAGIAVAGVVLLGVVLFGSGRSRA